MQKGDNFKVIYEELFIDGKSLGTGKIYGAQFNRSGSSITAIPFIQDEKESYFDTDGNSLRKAFPEGSIAVFKDQLTFFIEQDASYSENRQSSFWC